jgi:hypothetical protein
MAVSLTVILISCPDMFLPPADMPEIHSVSVKNLDGLNRGILFFRVSIEAVDFLFENLRCLPTSLRKTLEFRQIGKLYINLVLHILCTKLK